MWQQSFFFFAYPFTHHFHFLSSPFRTWLCFFVFPNQLSLMTFDGQNEACQRILSHFQFIVSFHLILTANWKEFLFILSPGKGTRMDLEDGRRESKSSQKPPCVSVDYILNIGLGCSYCVGTKGLALAPETIGARCQCVMGRIYSAAPLFSPQLSSAPDPCLSIISEPGSFPPAGV